MIKRLITYLFVFIGTMNLLLANDKLIYERFTQKLNEHSVVYNQYKSNNMPVLMGNTEMGGLADPFGRGMYETWLSDNWSSPVKRIPVKGFMLGIPEFNSQTPIEYNQKLSLVNAELVTEVKYEGEKSYQSSMFFSMHNKHQFVYKIKNTGKHLIQFVINVPYNGYNVDISDKNMMKGTSTTNNFTLSAWSLQHDVKIWGGVEEKFGCEVLPGETKEFIFSVYTHHDGINYRNKCFTKTDKVYNSLIENHNKAWSNNWENTGIVFIPEKKHEEIFYRSVFWLYCTSGEGRFLPAEAHFSKLHPDLASAYRYYSPEVYLHIHQWDMHPFTYGAPGWAAFSFTMLGNKAKAQNLLDNIYKPELLKRNVLEMFPIGESEVFDKQNKSLGVYHYLNNENKNAHCFGHELTYEGENYASDPIHRFDWAVHLNAFATANFYRFSTYFNDAEYHKNVSYPALRGCAEFYSELLNYDKEKEKYVLPLVLSMAEDVFCENPIDGVLGAKWVLMMAAEEANKLGVDDNLRDKWKKIADNIYIPEAKNHYLEFENDDFTRPGGGYQGIRGFSYFSFPTMELMKTLNTEKANSTLEDVWIRNKKGQDVVCFTISWFALAAAYLGNTDLAYEQLSYSNTQIDPSGTAMMEVFPFRPYYLDNYAAYVMTVISMLLQSYDDNIIPFAAIPNKWKDVEFYNLPAQGGIRVSGMMKDGEVAGITYTKDDDVLLKTKESSAVRVSEIGKYSHN